MIIIECKLINLIIICRRGSQAIATVLPSPPSIEIVKASMPHILLPEEISKKYREAIVHYSKYQYAGIIETEASFKATRISIEQNCTLQAASYLNNVVLINLPLSEQEKVRSDNIMQFAETSKERKVIT